MGYYIIRLDDACPTMNHENWNRIELILNQHNIKPIVGVIPDNKDPDFHWEEDSNFWEHVQKWQEAGWCIALHGLHHKYRISSRKNYFQKSHSNKTEFADIPLEEQKKMILRGIEIMKLHNIYPLCFYAPSHTFDANTVMALHDMNVPFVSDGYALYPYKKLEMTFLPSICNGPFFIPFGICTYVFHPSFMREKSFISFENFVNSYEKYIITAEEALQNIRDQQGLIGKILESGIYIARGLRNLRNMHEI